MTTTAPAIPSILPSAPVCPTAIFLQCREEKARAKARENSTLAGAYLYAANELKLTRHEHIAICDVCLAAEAASAAPLVPLMQALDKAAAKVRQ